MSDRTLAIASSLCGCWAVTVGVLAGLLGLLRVIPWTDPTGQIIGAIALGPFVLLVALALATAPFVALFELLSTQQDNPDNKREGLK